MNWRRAIVFVLAVLLAVASSFYARQAYADGEGAGSGESIVEQIGCDVTYTDTNTGQVSVISHGKVGQACQIDDFINLFIYLSKWGLSILAVLATLMFVYGGFQFVTAGGRPSKVDEGKRVLGGTVIGTIIALTAYVIINTTVTAVTGVTLTSYNPIGVVFGDKDNPKNTIPGQTILRPFSGTVPTGSSGSGSGTEVEACRLETSSWIRDCADDQLQVYCADPGPRDGLITSLQKTLSDVHYCNCGTPDGCYGKQTVDCVRRFQIANELPPTGVIDLATKDRIASGGRGCKETNQPELVSAKLPATVLAKTAGGDSKCCVVSDGTLDLYCVNGVSTRACQALGGGSAAYDGACGSGDTATRCGYCSNVPIPTTSNGSICFKSVSTNWCSLTQNWPITTPATPVTYFNNDCLGNCQQCIPSLRASFQP